MAGPERERADAAAFIRDAPMEIHEALLRRLSPKWILRMRSVCKAWRDKLSEAALLARLHHAAPPQLLLCFDRAACHDRHIQPREYCVDFLDLRSGKSRPIFRFTGNDNYDGGFMQQQLLVHGSLNGYLLVSFSRRWYVINPATRHWAPSSPFRDLEDFEMDVVGFYEHAPSGKYRVLCVRGRSINQEAATCTYYVVTLRTVLLRRIGRPISSAAAVDHGLGFGVDMACVSPPIQLKRNKRLHWPPQESQDYHILVFDTEKQEFSWKESPPVMNISDQDMRVRLLEFPNGNLGLSVSRTNNAALDLWCLQDYQNEVWVPEYRIQLQVQQMPDLNKDCWTPAVVSSEGDVLIQSPHWLLHCDSNGNVVRKFCFPEGALATGHVLRESLVQRQMFQEVDGDEPPFFHWRCSDPSW